MKPIYKPKGKAGEYAEYALNIYNGCTHGCTYCYAPSILRKPREAFHANVEPRKGIVEATRKQLASGEFEGKTIHLCFTCDPYPNGIDTTITRKVIELLKKAGCHVQILTKSSSAIRDFDLLDENDWFGTTITGGEKKEPSASLESMRENTLALAHIRGIKTWVSCEPVFDPETIYGWIKHRYWVDLFKIGKLNYQPSDIDWGKFGHRCEELCIEYGRNYLIKEDLRKEMA